MKLLISLGISLSLTLLIEMGVAVAFKKRGYSLGVVAAVNLLTNPPLVLAAHLLSLSPLLIWIGEGAVFWIEGGIYAFFKEDFKKPFLFSLLCNGLSCLAGILLNGGIL